MDQINLTDRQRMLLTAIPPAIGTAQEADWAPVLSEALWDELGAFPPGLVERHERSCPLVPAGGETLLGRGYCRLTAAGLAAVSLGAVAQPYTVAIANGSDGLLVKVMATRPELAGEEALVMAAEESERLDGLNPADECYGIQLRLAIEELGPLRVWAGHHDTEPASPPLCEG